MFDTKQQNYKETSQGIAMLFVMMYISLEQMYHLRIIDFKQPNRENKTWKFFVYYMTAHLA